ncbi:glycosyltransferase involved in cell wall biosynthesis [Micromonospora pisi]|uniref:Glycosyltransferase involved in cell wall biosynthesis n=1 Tax=Micromonospora pisi TaxID=589240 RepID=A0A495JNF6_9ACTN|nr:glycosyltransferase [Micromonospora pisi]RKR89904.1 glycosyltransferase involved in cell wall biosynthesis [Micromonospora pisi]
MTSLEDTRSSSAPSALLAGRSVALVHEWYGSTGGSEKVFLNIADLIPHGERFVLWKDDDATEELTLRQSWMARTPLRGSKALALPLMPVAWRTLSRNNYDVVISSSHAFAHTVKLGSSEQTRYLSYVHSPARYVWSPDFDGRGSNPMLAGPRKVLQAADLRLSRHVHSYAANSREVQARIRQYWHRDAHVINPPVDVRFYTAAPVADQQQNRDYLLGVGRWIKYKNFDLMIEIAAAAGLPLIIAGKGPEEESLRRAAEKVNVPVSFEVRPSDERLRQLYWGARALLFPTHEDFGIIPVEAQACGTPVIGFSHGGLLETVVDGETGFLIDSTDPRSFAPLVARLGELNPARVQANAANFSPTVFAERLSAWVRETTA